MAASKRYIFLCCCKSGWKNRIIWIYCSCCSEASTESAPQCEEVKEISNFLSQPLLERQQCHLEWWVKNSEDFPNLSQLAKKYLSAPGSTIYSERLFSEAVSVEMKFEEGTLSLTALESSLQDLLIEMEIIFKGKE